MQDETAPKTIQQKIKSLVAELERNGDCAHELAGMIPTILAAIPDGAVFDLINTTFKEFEKMWRPRDRSADYLFKCLVALIMHERTRRALVENVEVAELEKLAQA